MKNGKDNREDAHWLGCQWGFLSSASQALPHFTITDTPLGAGDAKPEGIKLLAETTTKANKASRRVNQGMTCWRMKFIDSTGIFVNS